MTTANRTLRRLIGAALGTATLGALVGVLAGPAAKATSISPTNFPSGVALDSSAYTMQFSGATREGTAAAIALDVALGADQTQGYPFSSSGTVQPKAPPSPSGSTHLYGPGSCPTTEVLVADDTPADALSAAALRSYSALQVVDTAGQTVTFNTTNTVLLLTKSGREQATALDPTTASALDTIRAKCTKLPDGIVLGGTSAIPDSVVSDFRTAVGDVARIAGADRFATAAAVAVDDAIGHGLPTVADFPSASMPSSAGTPLAKTVFLAEGQTGADALAVGPVAATSGVPVLLTDTGSLPSATQGVLTRLAPSHIIVLGGTAAVSDAVVSQATAAAAGSKSSRIAGADRYATSVDIAEQLMNLYPSYSGSAHNFYSDQLAGVARDEGSAAQGNYAGWPDALASAYYLAELATSKMVNPKRLAPPVEKSNTSGGSATDIAPSGACGTNTNCVPRYPLLLTTGAALAPPVDAYLKAMFPSSNTYTTPGAPFPGNDDGGFGFVFGGTAAVSSAATAAVASDLSGGTYTSATATDLAPTESSAPFFTTVDMSPFAAGPPQTPGVTPTVLNGSNTHPKACMMPATLTGAAGLLGIDQDTVTPSGAAEPVQYYGGMAAYPAGTSLGDCVDLSTEAALTGTADTATVYAASLSGHETPAATIVFQDPDILISGSGTTLGTATGDLGPPAQHPCAGSTSAQDVFTATGCEDLEYSPATSSVPGGWTFKYKGSTYSNTAVRLVVSLTRKAGANGMDVISWTGELDGFQHPTDTTPVFAAPVAKGVADVTPGNGFPILTNINLLGEYSTGSPTGSGAIVMQVVRPNQPQAVPDISGLLISGLS